MMVMGPGPVGYAYLFAWRNIQPSPAVVPMCRAGWPALLRPAWWTIARSEAGALIMQVLQGMCRPPAATQQDSSALATSIGAWRPQAQQASCSPPPATSPSQHLQPGAGSAAAASEVGAMSVPPGRSGQPGTDSCSLPPILGADISLPHAVLPLHMLSAASRCMHCSCQAKPSRPLT